MNRPTPTIATSAIPSVFTSETLPEFFQTENTVTFEELLEEYSQNGSDDETYVDVDVEVDVEDLQDGANHMLIQTLEDGIDDENITHDLLDFFHGVPYDSMEEFFRSFEFGETWSSNPVFTDEFVFCALPKTLSHTLYELHAVLQIYRVVPIDWDSEDARYSSLSVPQQTRLRELIHENPAQYRQLDDIHNRLKGYRCRTPYPQIKFLLNKTLEVVEDILRKEVLYFTP
jgi:hypothetical protein